MPLIAVYDKLTGTKLWEASRQFSPLAIKDGILYSVCELFMLDDDPVNRKIKIAAFNLRTGALKGERTYSWTDHAVTDGIYHGAALMAPHFLTGTICTFTKGSASLYTISITMYPAQSR